LKYGDLLQDYQDEESSSSSSSDDSQADLVQPKFEKKFLEVITAIRAGDKSILTKHSGETIFKDEDFEVAKKGEKVKKLTLKDQIRTDALRKIKGGEDASEADEDDNMFEPKGYTIASE
jgi:protein KRI1